MLYILDNAGRLCWVTHIKNILFEHGFGYVWIAQDVGQINLFIKVFTNRLKDCALQKLYADMELSPKTDHYKHYKTLLNPERYLSINLPYPWKKCLANFRCSGHMLMIEKGRHLTIVRELRYCPLCLRTGSRVTEDEYHFLLTCPAYNELILEHFRTAWLSHAGVQLFYAIMSSDTTNDIFSLTQFIYKAFDLRKQLLII